MRTFLCGGRYARLSSAKTNSLMDELTVLSSDIDPAAATEAEEGSESRAGSATPASQIIYDRALDLAAAASRADNAHVRDGKLTKELMVASGLTQFMEGLTATEAPSRAQRVTEAVTELDRWRPPPSPGTPALDETSGRGESESAGGHTKGAADGTVSRVFSSEEGGGGAGSDGGGGGSISEVAWSNSMGYD